MGLASSMILNKSIENLPWVTLKALPGEDIYDEVGKILSTFKNLYGGGHLIIPKVGGVGFLTRERIFVDFDNCVIELNENIKLTKNTVQQTPTTNPNNGSPNTPNLYDGVFIFRGSPSKYLKGCALFSRNHSRVDGNGIAIQAQGSYVHDAFQNGNYCAVQFSMCERPVCWNIQSYNSLSFGITMGYCPGGIIENCGGISPVHENGIQVGNNAEHIRTFNDTDQSTWGNLRIINCYAENCPNHGIGSYGAVGVFILNPMINKCGNNNGIEQAGPAGGVNVEHDGTNVQRNHRVTVIAPQITSSYGFAFRTNCAGTKLVSGFARNTKKPTAYTESNPTIWGSAVFVQGYATLEMIGFEIDGSDRVGVRANAAGSGYPSVKIVGGSIKGCKERAIHAISFNEFYISPDVDISDNGDSTSTSSTQLFTCEFNNAPANTDLGFLYFAGRYRNNQGPVCSTSRVGTVVLNDIFGGENNANTNAGIYHSLDIQNVFKHLTIGNIALTADNLKQSRVVRVAGTIGKLMCNPASVMGYQIGAALPKVDFTTATLSQANNSAEMFGVKSGLGALTVPAASGGVPGTLSITCTVSGVTVGDIVHASLDRGLQGCLIIGEVTGALNAADNVTVKLYNFTGSAVNIATGGTLSVKATKVLGN